MKIVTRLSEQNYKYICRSLAQKKIPYISLSHFKEDYQEQRAYILEECGKPVAMCSLVWNDKHQNFAIKRLICFRKRNAGRGYAGFLISHIPLPKDASICCTPWADNLSMRHLLEKNGFLFKYMFSEYWCFYEKLTK